MSTQIQVDRTAEREVSLAKLPTWMIEMAKAVGAKRSPREDIGDVLERLAGDALEREYDDAVAANKASRGDK